MSWRDAPFDPRFFEKSALFWPIRRVAERFTDHADWPPVSAYARVFEEDPVRVARSAGSRTTDDPVRVARSAGSRTTVDPVRFVEMAPKPRRRRAPVETSSLYDARIVRGEVPTRARSWHDFTNALVWGAFPRAKAALHARQHRLIASRARDGDARLPPQRTRELDALALLDEGGIVVAGDVAMIFGHAIYEGLAAGGPPVHGAACVVGEVRGEDIVAAADEALAAVVRDEGKLLDPGELARMDVERLRAPAL